MRENLHVKKTTANCFFDQLKIKLDAYEKGRQEVCKMFDKYQSGCEDKIVNRLSTVRDFFLNLFHNLEDVTSDYHDFVENKYSDI